MGFKLFYFFVLFCLFDSINLFSCGVQDFLFNFD